MDVGVVDLMLNMDINLNVTHAFLFIACNTCASREEAMEFVCMMGVDSKILLCSFYLFLS